MVFLGPAIHLHVAIAVGVVFEAVAPCLPGRVLDYTPREPWAVRRDGGRFDPFAGATITLDILF